MDIIWYFIESHLWLSLGAGLIVIAVITSVIGYLVRLIDYLKERKRS